MEVRFRLQPIYAGDNQGIADEVSNEPPSAAIRRAPDRQYRNAKQVDQYDHETSSHRAHGESPFPVECLAESQRDIGVEANASLKNRGEGCAGTGGKKSEPNDENATGKKEHCRDDPQYLQPRNARQMLSTQGMYQQRGKEQVVGQPFHAGP